MTTSSLENNPLLEAWTGPFEAPPFERIEPRPFPPGLRTALNEARQRSTPSRKIPRRRPSPIRSTRWSAAGATSTRSRRLLQSCRGGDQRRMQAVEREMAPVLSRHRSETYFNEALFAASKPEADEEKLALMKSRRACSNATISKFTRAGAGLPPESQGAARRDRRAAGDLGGAVRPERSGRRKRLPDAARRR